MTWRNKFRPIVERILAAGGGDAELLAAWRAMDLGPSSSASWPYQVWREEIARQRGTKKPKPKRKVRTMTADEARRWMAERQTRMFE